MIRKLLIISAYLLLSCLLAIWAYKASLGWKFETKYEFINLAADAIYWLIVLVAISLALKKVYKHIIKPALSKTSKVFRVVMGIILFPVAVVLTFLLIVILTSLLDYASYSKYDQPRFKEYRRALGSCLAWGGDPRPIEEIYEDWERYGNGSGEYAC